MNILANLFRDLFERVTWPIRTIVSQPMRLFSAPRKLFGLSLPVRLAIFTVLFLLISGGVAFWLFQRMPDRSDVSTYLSFTRMAIVGVLLFVIPFLVYKVTAMWLQGEASQFPEIDAAWKAGVKAFQDQGIDLCDVPLFVVTGVGEQAHAKALMQAAERSFTVNGVPDSAAPLQWYGDASAAYLVLVGSTRVGVMSSMTPNTAVGSGGVVPSGGAKPAGGKGMFTATVNFESEGSGGGGGGEVVDVVAEPVAPAPPSSYGASLMLPSSGTDFGPGPASRAAAAPVRIAKLPDNKEREIDAKMRYVATLIAGARQPYCPINGIMALLPFHLIRGSDAQGIELQKAAFADVELLRTSLRLRCPVSVLVSGMETESGFRVLARRIGREKGKSHRFGKGNDSIWTLPEPDHVEAIARNACGAFEDWVYHLFSAADGLSRTDNGKLYSILCLVRTELQERLTNVLCSAYGRDQADAVGDEPMLFSGCYFGATGQDDDKQAFVKAVFDKLAEQEEQLSWTTPAVAENRRFGALARTANLLNLALIIAVVVMLASGPFGYKDKLQAWLPGAVPTGTSATP